ncbi:transcription termination factor Rho [Rhodococcus sp. MTM3W5.2]|uniref:transcription termination factor Rho n=1 Tax=Rhodococcus sp. MTM3W5.2 TaxID=1805827 RepID=UPI000979289C|nr:transcription termination factor Rho [Rhodococcus sp. MTM3W5.2]AQA25713.1 transcription termination factor Rho [Rhodococcus sp. MTM3W5.2]
MTDTDLIATPALDTPVESAASQAGGTARTSEATGDAVAASTKRAEARRGAGLSGMVLAELRGLATELGIKGTSGLRKGDLIAAIKERQGGSTATKSAPKAALVEAAASEVTTAPQRVADVAPAAESAPATTERPAAQAAESAEGEQGGRRNRQRRGSSRQAGSPEQGESTASTAPATEQGGDRQPRQEQAGERNRRDRNQGERNQGERNQGERGQGERNQGERNQGERGQGERNQGERNQGERGQGERNQGERNQGERGQGERNQGERNQGGNGPRGEGRNDNRGGEDEDGRGRRGRRFRERRRGRDRGEGGGAGVDRDMEIREDDVLQPVAGILDVLDNYAFVRTSGYLAGPNDVYVSMNLIRKNGLRRGDAITGAVRVAREGEGGGGGSQRQKFNPLVRLDTVNGGDVEAAKRRPEFGKLTPLYPNQRLRLETTPNILTTRVIDLVMPIGKGQRALIVSPPKAGKTSVLQAIANAIATNNPECYLMVVLVDERPEEVTDMQRSVKGEVIASTFDRPPSDHTSVAELAIERAKRLVEEGKDVVVLLDSITRLGRAYNNSSPASGRILSGGVDSTALYPPKRFLGAARNIENGGSLTIIATAMVETGSTGDTVIFEEFKGTGNAELKLDRKIAERRVFPAVDVNPSGTRKDELLLNPDEAAVLHKLRRVLSGLDSHQAIDLLIDRLKKSKNNLEFLMQVSKTAPGAMGDDD